jgi:hypothetical protein
MFGSVEAVYYAVIGLVVGGTIIYELLSYFFSDARAKGWVLTPVRILSAAVIIVLIYTMVDTAQEQTRQGKSALRNNLSDFTQRVIVDGWETYALEVEGMYDEIIQPFAPGEPEMMRRMAQTSQPYLTKKGREKEWHYAARFVQEMVNIARKFALDTKFPIAPENLERIAKTPFAGWFVCLRLYLNSPVVRNVWERYKYRHVNPYFSAWVHYFIIDPVDKDPAKFWREHRAQWDKSLIEFMDQKTYKEFVDNAYGAK